VATYEHSTAISKAYLLQTFFRTDMKEGTSVREHLAWFDHTLSDMARAGINVGGKETQATTAAARRGTQSTDKQEYFPTLQALWIKEPPQRSLLKEASRSCTSRY